MGHSVVYLQSLIWFQNSPVLFPCSDDSDVSPRCAQSVSHELEMEDFFGMAISGQCVFALGDAAAEGEGVRWG